MAGPQEKLQGAVTAAMDRLDRAYIRKLSVRRRLHVSSIASARLIGWSTICERHVPQPRRAMFHALTNQQPTHMHTPTQQKKAYLCMANCHDQGSFDSQALQQCVGSCSVALQEVNQMIGNELSYFQGACALNPASPLGMVHPTPATTLADHV